MADADLPPVHAETREQWRAWLAEHWSTAPGAFLVSWKKSTGRPAVGYEESVEEALCVGWVDSTRRPLDHERSMLRFTPRRPGSGWARTNKSRVERLLAEGRMTPPGLEVVQAAKRDGSWTLLDAVEDLVVPDDLAVAFDAHPGAREQWESFPKSARRALLAWIVQAKRAETRVRRVEETAQKAAVGERANAWRPR